MPKVQILEVGLRDGLQNEQKQLTLADRFQLIKKLSLTGLKRMELGSFVSPKAIVQMKCVPELTKKVLKAQKKGLLPKNIQYSAFVPNLKGFERAIDCGLDEVSVFVSCTDSFSKKNINMNVEDSFNSLKKICQRARALGIKVRGYLSVVFGCPYEGQVSKVRAADLADRMMQQGLFELALSDTIGVANPVSVNKVIERVQKKVSIKKLALHFHDTRGLALVNVLTGLQCGVRIFDASIGGMGGCPYAKGASGNVVTEDMVYFLEKMNYHTGVQIQKLIPCTHLLEKKLSRTLPSKLSKVSRGINNKSV